MKTKNIFKALALAMLMPAMMLTTACSSEDDAVNNGNDKKGYPLQVTVNVTRQGENTSTRATYNESTKKLSFSSGDQLFVYGKETAAGWFAGTLTWTSGGTFSGTITTENEWTGSAEELLEAAVSNIYTYANASLLPANYGEYHCWSITDNDGYNACAQFVPNKAFALTKATAVEQLSYESAEYTNGKGFELKPQNAILNFTIAGLTGSTAVDVALTGPSSLNITGSVTTDGSGTATFAVGVGAGTDFKDLSLTVGDNDITLGSSSKVLEAGKIYNITRSVAAAPAAPEGAIDGKFTINSSGDKVYFSKGNLQASTTDLGENWTWAFAATQWDYIGDAADYGSILLNGTFSANVTVDLFGWVGASSTFTGAAMYGISIANEGYGNKAPESLKSDWGKTIGSDWRTLTRDEWVYLFVTRTTGGTVGSTAYARYTHATINTDGTGVNGMILFPDGVNFAASEFTTLGTVNGTSDWSTKCTSVQWTALANKGCVFLPAAGWRSGPGVLCVGSDGLYWSSSSDTDYVSDAYFVNFYSDCLDPQSYSVRTYGYSVRLVCAAN